MTEFNHVSDHGVLGIDAGGTFTDLIFYDPDSVSVPVKIKVPTEHDDLLGTIEDGIRRMAEKGMDPASIRAVNLATTLATNAIVENRLQPAALILIGYDEAEVEKWKNTHGFGTERVYAVSGGHSPDGSEREPLDITAVEKVISSLDPEVCSVGISGYFSVRNPSHEDTVYELVKKLRPGLTVSRGHDLVAALDAFRRATTTALNAGLIPIVVELLKAVEDICRRHEIKAPLMVVRGDGSLVDSAWAEAHPVEMIMSGPAASACGAWWLSQQEKAEKRKYAAERFSKHTVVDIGGTTTDIIELDGDGVPVVCGTGAVVGGHRTLIKAIDIRTFGLGGDSRVSSTEGSLTVGPRRVIPLCRAASVYPSMLDELRGICTGEASADPVFLKKKESVSPEQAKRSFEREILEALEDGPRLMSGLVHGEFLVRYFEDRFDAMEADGLVEYISFTPTDALHAAGLMDIWDREASVLGAKCMCGSTDDAAAEKFSSTVIKTVSRMIVTSVLEKSLDGAGFRGAQSGDVRSMLDFIARRPWEDSPFRFVLQSGMTGAGAPAWAFVPEAAAMLDTDCSILENSDVAGAVGAAVGSFRMDCQAYLIPSKNGTVIYAPVGVKVCGTAQDPVETALGMIIPWLKERAEKAGASDPKITWTRSDGAPDGEAGNIGYGLRLTFRVTDG